MKPGGVKLPGVFSGGLRLDRESGLASRLGVARDSASCATFAGRSVPAQESVYAARPFVRTSFGAWRLEGSTQLRADATSALQRTPTAGAVDASGDCCLSRR